jgi:uncharacterized membrane protein
MIVLVVLFGFLLFFRLAGALGIKALKSWKTSARWALSAMMLFTAIAHFNNIKGDLIRMVPPWVPWPGVAVAFTGICEILAAIGIQVPSTRRIAGILLILFFICVLPANIHAANAGLNIAGEPTTPLWLRIPMQIFFIILTWWVTRPESEHSQRA